MADQTTSLPDLQQTLGYTFKDESLLQTALTHPSYVAEQKDSLEQNQRLEFLGDAVLQLAATDILYHYFPEREEGELSKLRAAITNDETLAVFANQLRLGDFVYLGKGEEDNGGRQRCSTLSDAFEAVLGALYLDGGFQPALSICRQLSTHVLTQETSLQMQINPKGLLQELTQECFSDIPTYEIKNVRGPEHAPEFEVVVKLGERVLASGQAGNRKNAEKQAAAAALQMLQEESKHTS